MASDTTVKFSKISSLNQKFHNEFSKDFESVKFYND